MAQYLGWSCRFPTISHNTGVQGIPKSLPKESSWSVQIGEGEWIPAVRLGFMPLSLHLRRRPQQPF